jgi:phage protein U
MAKYLISVTETYRVDTEAEAAKIIEEAKVDGKYVLSKYSSVKKERKQKGEIIDEWYRLTLTKVFDDEKEPIGSATIEYNTDGSAF